MDKSIEFYVNEEKRTVVAVKNNTERFFVRFLQSNHAYILPSNRRDDEKLYMPNRFEGVAHCSPEDEFDVELGKLIAYDKLKRKLNRSFRKRFAIYQRIMNEHYNHVCHAANNYITKLQDNDLYRAEVIGKRLDDQ